MKKILIFTVLIVSFFPYLIFGQLKNQDKPVQIKQEIIQPLKDQFFGLSIFDPSKFSMSHSISMSYFSSGGKGISQNLYLNTMTYQIGIFLIIHLQKIIRHFKADFSFQEQN